MTAKSVLIELDSIHSDTLHHYMGRGDMPRLSELTAQGNASAVTYELPTQSAAWISMQSGLSAAQHQHIGYDNLIPGSYVTRRGLDHVASVPKYWDRLARGGRRVLVVNPVNATRPTRLEHGVALCGFSTHILGVYPTLASEPPGLARGLAARYPRDPFHLNDWGGKAYVNPLRLLDSVRANLDRKGAVYRELIEGRDWDHVHAGLDDLHAMGHMLGDLIGARVLDGPVEERVAGALDGVWSALDRAIGAVVDAAGKGTTILVVALGGIGQTNAWSHNLDEILDRFEHGPRPPRMTLYSGLGTLWTKLPHRAIRTLLPLKSYARDRYLAPKRRAALAFACPTNEESGAIRVNLKGREPAGRIDPGPRYEALCRELGDALRSLRDVETGTPLVDDVVHAPSALGSDPEAPSALPDLVVVWSRHRAIRRVHGPRLGQIEVGFSPSRWGDHVLDGMLVAGGPGWRGGRAGEPVGVLDFAPTIVNLHGVAAEPGWPGRSLRP